MTISNFKLIEVIGGSPFTWKFRATVDVTSGFLFFKKKETLEIFRNYTSYFWFFIDSGKFCPSEVLELERFYVAKKGKDLEHCLPKDKELSQ